MKQRIVVSWVVNDLKRNRVINSAVFLFLLISALLMSSGMLMIERLSGSLDELYEIAKPPHFLQMHIGDYDREAIQKFSEGTDLVESMHVQEMVNVDGVSIDLAREGLIYESFSDSMLDNYFVSQNDSFDFLLDLDNQIVRIASGEVGVPVAYARAKQIEVGDQLILTVSSGKMTLSVSAILRDAQMGSSLASSIRFLVHQDDLEQLQRESFRQESIIGFRLKSDKDISRFSGLYESESAQMPQNGIGITFPLIRLVNGIGDGLMGGMIIVVSVLLLVIALISMRFTILSTIEDDIREIGTLKAIGISNRDIKGLYSSKYRVLAGLACLIAAFASHGVSAIFLENVSLNFGLSRTSIVTYTVPVIAVLVLFLCVMRSLHNLLKRVFSMTVLDALIEGSHLKGKQKKIFSLCWTAKRPLAAMSWHQFKSSFKAWSVLSIVFCISVFAMLLPLNLYMTMQSDEFIQYVGAAKSDVRITLVVDSDSSSDDENSVLAIESQLVSDGRLKQWHRFKTIKASLESAEGKRAFQVESGDYRTFPVVMDQGHLPTGAGEIALSALNMARLELVLGQTVELTIDEQAEVFEVVGVYQDITHGGLTAKIAERASGSISQYSYFVNFSEGVDANGRQAFIDEVAAKHPRARVLAVKELTAQTLGTITASLLLAVVGIAGLVLVILVLITVLFMRLKMHRQWTEDAGLLAVGFKVLDLRKLYVYQGGSAIVLGVLLGALASLTLGTGIVNLLVMVMQFGLTKISFLVNPWQFVLVGLLLPILVGFVLVWCVTKRVAHLRVASLGSV